MSDRDRDNGDSGDSGDTLFMLVSANDLTKLQSYLYDNQSTVKINRTRTFSGFSALHKAATYGFTDICQVLIPTNPY